MMDSHICIGGPIDGQRVHCDKLQYVVAENLYPASLKSLGVEADETTTMKEHVYLRDNVLTGVTTISFLRHESLTCAQAIERLFEVYAAKGDLTVYDEHSESQLPFNLSFVNGAEAFVQRAVYQVWRALFRKIEESGVIETTIERGDAGALKVSARLTVAGAARNGEPYKVVDSRTERR